MIPLVGYPLLYCYAWYSIYKSDAVFFIAKVIIIELVLILAIILAGIFFKFFYGPFVAKVVAPIARVLISIARLSGTIILSAFGLIRATVSKIMALF